MQYTHKPANTISDKVAFGLVKFFRFFADVFFGKRYGNRAIVLETVAAVPGLVGGGLQHLWCLRKIKDDHGWIKQLLDEAENERIHLMAFIEIAKPNIFERIVIFFAQMIFVIFFTIIYVLSMKTAHRFVGYLEEEAVVSYIHYLEAIDNGSIENIPAPQIVIEYWKMSTDAKLRDVVKAVCKDEEAHRDVNHFLSDQLENGGGLSKPYIK